MFDEAETERLIDIWHEGYFSHDTARNPHVDSISRHEWEEGRRTAADDRKVRVVMPPRTEGYYHAPLNDF